MKLIFFIHSELLHTKHYLPSILVMAILQSICSLNVYRILCNFYTWALGIVIGFSALSLLLSAT
jgi:hypothetical protein